MGRFTHLLTDTVTYASPSTVSAMGDVTYGTQATAAARVEYDYRIVDAGDGKKLELTHTIVTETAIPKGARVWLPGDSIGSTAAAKIVVFQSLASVPDGSDTLYELSV